ncbi:hypothetical protein PV328_011409 [Microctonus aethiopoides]|nr:hypothetical protein PV328_011409 [Microctonus aethiopoides]
MHSVCTNKCDYDNLCRYPHRCVIIKHQQFCDTRQIADERSQSICFLNKQCNNNEQCRNFKCINPCEWDYSPCGPNANCYVDYHQPICKCPSGYEGNAYYSGCKEISYYNRGTEKKSCDWDSQCPTYEQCIQNKCESACKNIECGDGKICYTENHVHHCDCLPGYELTNDGECIIKSRSFVKTKKSSVCFKNEDCKDDEECAQNKCVPSCERAPGCGLDNTRCNAADHAHTCECLSGFSGDPYSIDGCH